MKKEKTGPENSGPEIDDKPHATVALTDCTRQKTWKINLLISADNHKEGKTTLFLLYQQSEARRIPGPKCA
ncbi:TPA: hypothetical protein QHN47_004113 [Klebsiella aerogenes]|nr:hypothetical protein [Klebsiella aerogenes]ELJ2009214.1 hypothetical protein [Klebsiella aerogenes]HDT4319067.1 hypothetical protein [Klebsiella aerogenes]